MYENRLIGLSRLAEYLSFYFCRKIPVDDTTLTAAIS